MLKTIIIIFPFLFDNTIATCSPGCNETLIGNSNCDTECNNTYCNFDGGDCLYLLEINNNTNNEIYNSILFYDTVNTESCNLTNCPNLFFDDCNILQTHTTKWCNFDNDDHNYDICCAKYHTDCCQYNLLSVFIASICFIFIILCGCYGAFKIVSNCFDD